MHGPRHSSLIALAGVVLIAVLSSAGCARRIEAGGSLAIPTATPITTLAADAATPSPAAEATTPAPAPTASTPAAPVATPNLAAIDGLIKDIEKEIGADASAGADEGSPQ